MLLKDDETIMKMSIYSMKLQCKKKGELLNEFNDCLKNIIK